MAISDKLQELLDIKQDIKVAIETKGIPMTNVAFTEYANKILDISGGGGVVDEYFYYSKAYYTITNNATLFSNAWQDSKNESWIVVDEIYNIKLTQAYSNIELLPGVPVDIYTGDGLDDLFDDLENGIFFELGERYFISGDEVFYAGDVKDALELPVSMYMFGDIFSDPTAFLISDISTFGVPGVSYALIRIASNPNKDFIITVNHKYKTNGIIIPENWESIEEYSFIGDSRNTEKVETNNLEELDVPLIIPNSVKSIGKYAFDYWRNNNQPLVIPEGVTNIGNCAFSYWESNNQPLVILEGVTIIGSEAFRGWTSNNKPLVIPNSVTSIGRYAFEGWTSNNKPLVIPDSVTSIGTQAFYGWALVPYVEIQAITPPTLANADAFGNQNNAPIYVPDESVEAYKTATNWVDLADRIFPISDK